MKVISRNMKYCLLTLLILPKIIFAQENQLYPDEFARGLIMTNEGNFLRLDNGFLKLPDYDPYEEYYRMIYKDSTIVNPNLIISNQFTINIIPYLIPSIITDREFLFEEPLNLALFIELKGSQNYGMTDYGISILDSLIRSE